MRMIQTIEKLLTKYRCDCNLMYAYRYNERKITTSLRLFKVRSIFNALWYRRCIGNDNAQD